MNAYRRLSVLLIASALLGMTELVHATQVWKFKVFLDDQEIGEHRFQLSKNKHTTQVSIQADFDVYILFINAYSYTHTNHEVWRGKCLKAIRSSTDDNGTRLQVYAESKGQQLLINTNAGQHLAEGCIKTFAYWDPTFLESQTLLNAQTGALMPVTINYLGKKEISVRNTPTMAKHYRLHTKDFTIDLWYSKQDEWLALNSTTSDGYTLRYQLQ